MVKDDPVIGKWLPSPVVARGTALPQVQPQSTMLLPLDDNFRKAAGGRGSAQAAMDATPRPSRRYLHGGYTIGPPPG